MLVVAAAERHLVLEGPLRHAAPAVLLEDVRGRSGRRRDAGRGTHRFHVLGGVLVGHDLDGRGELDVAADVVAMRVRVDDHRHRLVGDALDLLEQRLPPARVLGVDDDHAGRGDEDGAVPSTAGAPSCRGCRWSFSTSTTRGAGCPPAAGACCSAAADIESAPAVNRIPSTTNLFMRPSWKTRRS